MLTLEVFVSKLRRELKEGYQQVGDSLISGGANNMEQYKYLLGQAKAYQQVDQVISDLLNPKEKKNEQSENVVDFERSPES